MSSRMSPVFEYLLKAGVYSFGPFFCYPWKPIVNAIWGDSYNIGYKHFYTQHKDPTNLAMHLVCLLFQLFGNFSFLSALDAKLLPALGVPMSSYLSLSSASAVLWSVLSVLTPSATCPLSIKLASASAIAVAYKYAPQYTGQQIELAAYGGIAVVFVLHLLKAIVNSSKKPIKESVQIDKQGVTILAALVGKWAIYFGLKNYGLTGSLQSSSNLVAGGFVGLMLLLAAKANPLKPIVTIGSFGTTILSVLLNEPTFNLFNCAYTATVLQGLAHSLSGETATLLMLENETDESKKLAYEYSHVVYFPNLLLQTIYNVATGRGI